MSLRVSEQHFTDTVVEFAAIKRWLVHHDRASRTKTGWSTAIQGHKGFPDLVLSHPVAGALVFELKSATGKLDPDQVKWLNTFHNGGTRTAVVYPKHMEAIFNLLAKTKPKDPDEYEGDFRDRNWQRFEYELAKDAERCFGPW